MRSIFFGVMLLLESTAVVHPAQAENHAYAQAYISHQKPKPISGEQLISVDPTHPDEDALTRRIEQDNTRLDRLIRICRAAELKGQPVGPFLWYRKVAQAEGATEVASVRLAGSLGAGAELPPLIARPPKTSRALQQRHVTSAPAREIDRLSDQLFSSKRKALGRHAVVITRKPVVEQQVAARHLPRILGRQRLARRHRLLVGAGRGRRFRDRAPCEAKGQHDQDRARYTTADSGGDRRQSKAAARGRHGQFTIQ
jgi:hypothetical protein